VVFPWFSPWFSKNRPRGFRGFHPRGFHPWFSRDTAAQRQATEKEAAAIDALNNRGMSMGALPTYESVLNEPQISQALRTIQEKETAQNQQAIDAIYSRMITAISENPGGTRNHGDGSSG
jgi:hypothetical protein